MTFARKTLALCFGLILLVPGLAQAGSSSHPCATEANFTDPKNTEIMEYYFDSSVPTIVRNLTNHRAKGYWNDGSCNQGGDDFPTFRETGSAVSSGKYTSVSGRSVFRFPISYEYNPNPTSSTCAGSNDSQGIVLRSHYKSSNFTLECPVFKAIQKPNHSNRQKLAGMLIGHEFVHMLGLGDSSCSSDIMKSPISNYAGDPDKNRTPTHDSCEKADVLNTTNREARDECLANPDCTSQPIWPTNNIGRDGPGGGPLGAGGDDLLGGPGGVDDPHFTEIQVTICRNVEVQGAYSEICWVRYIEI